MTQPVAQPGDEAIEVWRDIATAPKDAGRVWVKRVYDGQVVKEGWAIWGKHPDPLFDGDPERWMNEDGRFAFPQPTHWKPANHS